MSTAPERPLMRPYSGADPYEMIDTRMGKMERWRAVAQETGELSALVELNKQIRSNSVGIAARLDARERDLNARADAINARELQHAVKVTQFVDFVGKAATLFDRLQKARADQAEEPLAAPPGADPSDQNKPPEPVLELEDDAIAGTSPDLAVPPEEQERHFAEGLRLRTPITHDQDEPPAAGVEFPTDPLPHPAAQQQPISAGLDAEEIEETNRGN